MKHFAAVEALGLSTEVAFSIGAASGARVQHSMVQTVIRLATGAGASPWTILRHYGRLWTRLLARTASVTLEDGATSDSMAMRWSWV